MPIQLTTYAQNREDYFIYALLGHIKEGFYVDVGSHHPNFHSVTRLFYDMGWRGINIEPNPILNKEFVQKRRRDINLNIGASNKTGTLTFRNYPHHAGLSTFSEAIQKIHEEEGLPHEEYKVKVETLKSVFRKNNVKVIDFLKIDVEGYELEVIEGNDWNKYRPKVVIIEATVRHQLASIMKKHGYEQVFFDGLNNYYVDKTLGDTITIYNYAPRILANSLYTSREKDLEKEIKEKDDKIAALEKGIADAQAMLEKSLTMRIERKARRVASRHKSAVKSVFRNK